MASPACGLGLEGLEARIRAERELQIPSSARQDSRGRGGEGTASLLTPCVMGQRGVKRTAASSERRVRYVEGT